MCAAGLPTDKFHFIGFLLPKSQQRQNQLADVPVGVGTIICYDTARRIKDSLQDVAAVFGPERELVLAKELTKTFETIKGAPLGELHDWVAADSNQQRGECVVLVAGWTAPENEEAVSSEVMRVLDLLLAEMPLKRAAALAAEITGVRKNVLYQIALEKQKDH